MFFRFGSLFEVSVEPIYGSRRSFPPAVRFLFWKKTIVPPHPVNFPLGGWFQQKTHFPVGGGIPPFTSAHSSPSSLL